MIGYGTCVARKGINIVGGGGLVKMWRSMEVLVKATNW